MRALILVSCVALALSACTTAQKEQVSDVTARICTSLPLAQAAYDAAVDSNDPRTVDVVLGTLRVSCPLILAGIQLVPTRTVTVPVPVPTPTPERG